MRLFLTLTLMPVQMKMRVRNVRRTEMSGGRLLELALSSVMPGAAQFPFSMRVTADVLATDGAAAGAAVSAASLAVLSAGIPISSLVAGGLCLLYLAVTLLPGLGRLLVCYYFPDELASRHYSRPK